MPTPSDGSSDRSGSGSVAASGGSLNTLSARIESTLKDQGRPGNGSYLAKYGASDGGGDSVVGADFKCQDRLPAGDALPAGVSSSGSGHGCGGFSAVSGGSAALASASIGAVSSDGGGGGDVGDGPTAFSETMTTTEVVVLSTAAFSGRHGSGRRSRRGKDREPYLGAFLLRLPIR